MINLQLWQKIALYVLILLSIFVFVQTSKLKINNVPIIKLKYRILLALFFPLIILLAFILGSIFIGLIVGIIAIFTLRSYLLRKKMDIERKAILKKS